MGSLDNVNDDAAGEKPCPKCGGYARYWITPGKQLPDGGFEKHREPFRCECHGKPDDAGAGEQACPHCGNFSNTAWQIKHADLRQEVERIKQAASLLADEARSAIAAEEPQYASEKMTSIMNLCQPGGEKEAGPARIPRTKEDDELLRQSVMESCNENEDNFGGPDMVCECGTALDIKPLTLDDEPCSTWMVTPCRRCDGRAMPDDAGAGELDRLEVEDPAGEEDYESTDPEVREIMEAAQAHTGANRMAMGLSCIPHPVKGDMEKHADLLEKHNTLRREVLDLTRCHSHAWYGALMKIAKLCQPEGEKDMAATVSRLREAYCSKCEAAKPPTPGMRCQECGSDMSWHVPDDAVAGVDLEPTYRKMCDVQSNTIGLLQQQHADLLKLNNAIKAENADLHQINNKLQRDRRDLLKACQAAARFYDRLAIETSPLDCAVAHGPDYRPPSDDEWHKMCLELRGELNTAIAAALPATLESDDAE